jgi:uncharacterized protein
MNDKYTLHNQFNISIEAFQARDPHLQSLSRLTYQYHFDWWKDLAFEHPGIYILTGGRQVGKSTSCKQLLLQVLKQKTIKPNNLFYLPCDEIFDAKELGVTLRLFLDETSGKSFLIVIDEITFVPHWDRTIKALADEGWFNQGLCLLTGSDTLILKEAAMSFPGRRGYADKTDFHLYPLNFRQYCQLITKKNEKPDKNQLRQCFEDYLQCGGYLRAINDFAINNVVSQSTFQTYEQWIRGDFLKQGKQEVYLLSVLQALIEVGVSQISYSTLTQKVGDMSKDTLINYCQLLERMDILFHLQAFDQNKKQGFPRKNRKFHFTDPFICRTIVAWLTREGLQDLTVSDNTLVEACLASHCNRLSKTYYFKGQGEIDVIWCNEKTIQAIEVKWANQIKPTDLKMLKHFKHALILTKQQAGDIEHIQAIPVDDFLYDRF